MAYHRKRKRRFNYDCYYAASNYELEKKFAPIVEDLKDFFFSMPTTPLNSMLKAYGEEYGEKAYNYACDTYSLWKTGSRQISSQTLLRLVKTLPVYLTEKQRITLLDKLLEFHNPFQIQYDYISTTWEKYNEDIFKLQQKIRNEVPSQFKVSQIPPAIADEIQWVFDNDMLLAQRIYNEYLYKKYMLNAATAIKDLSIFRNTCDEMKRKDMIYNDQLSITLKLFTKEITLTVEKKRKPLLRMITDFF